ncbi:formylglycine-generating enzyme family protein [Salibaculum halophilum]|uniref:formylglycine-generating enzyme family protein n=1 Tax=Salibaculum halophilum TaxID=1914408 RepID=UPI001FE7D8D5|nr:SUMF1/EgtB/PvdO family nonheme iron enzyme [Salibaculum halophilum]
MTAPRTMMPAARYGLITAVLIAAGVALLGAAPDWRGPETTPSDVTEAAFVAVTRADGAPLHVQKHEVTVADWNRCHDGGGCTLRLRARPGQDPAVTPATGISHADSMEYLHWINDETGQAFRLPTAAEWREIARPVLHDDAAPIFTDPALDWASTYLSEGEAPRALRPQGSFSTTPAGIADLDGSVWEWTQDCYAGAAQGVDPARCPAYLMGGEHVAAMSYLIRDPARGGCAVGTPPAHLGLRLVSDRPVTRP